MVQKWRIDTIIFWNINAFLVESNLIDLAVNRERASFHSTLKNCSENENENNKETVEVLDWFLYDTTIPEIFIK